MCIRDSGDGAGPHRRRPGGEGGARHLLGRLRGILPGPGRPRVGSGVEPTMGGRRPLKPGWAVLALLMAPDPGEPIETRIPADGAALYVRTIGRGAPVIVLHGGPDFDHGYLLPELDRWKDGFRLVYYDQRGRGKSAENVRPEDVTLASDVEDLDRVRRHLGVEAPAILGHSWGALLALEYALRHPTHVSRLILMN